MFRYDKAGNPSTEVYSQPSLVFFYQLKYFLVCNRIYIAYYQEEFVVPHQLSHIFPEQRERRVGNDYVGLFKQFDTFRTAKVPVSFEVSKFG